MKNKTYQTINNVFFIGIGGIGMSAIARFFNANGKTVKGYDKTPSPLTAQLQKEGISICFEDSVETLDKNTDLVVYTPAIPNTQQQLNWYKTNKYEVKKRSEVLGWISQDMFCIAVAGSHGKTTVSSMIAHLLNETIGCTAFLGGIANNFKSNYINSGQEIVVVEADEYDRSFLTLQPNISIITSIDSDHLDIYGNFENIVKEFRAFAQLNATDGTLILNQKVKDYSLNKRVKNEIYALEDEAICLQKNEIIEGQYQFDVNYKGEIIQGFKLPMAGLHNVENALAAISVCKTLGIKNEAIKTALANFKGIYRRFEKRAEKENVIYIDDYAHHPNEVNALLFSARKMYPNTEIIVVFQPHLFSRTKDLATEFAEALSQAEEVVLLPIYPARELPIKNVSSQLILDKIKSENKKILAKEEIEKWLEEKIKNIEKKQIILTVGAGDIDRLVPSIASIINKV